MDGVDSILSITTDLCITKAKKGLEYTWSSEVSDQSALQMQVDAISLLYKLELEQAFHQQQLDAVIAGAPGMHKVANAANVSAQLGLKKVKC